MHCLLLALGFTAALGGGAETLGALRRRGGEAVGGRGGAAARGGPCRAPEERGWLRDFPLAAIQSARHSKYMDSKPGSADADAGGNFLGGNLYPNFWRYLQQRFNLQSALDAACGLGESTRGMKEAGIPIVYGFDGLRQNVAESPETILYHDIKSAPFLVGKVVDFAWCSEVLEHIDHDVLPNMMLTLMQAKYVAANAAAPGQTGHHHVTLKTWPDFWLPLFAKYGFEEVTDVTRDVLQDPQYMREKNRGHMWWALDGHSPGRVLRNKHLQDCDGGLSCFNAYLAAVDKMKDLPPPEVGAKDPVQAKWELANGA